MESRRTPGGDSGVSVLIRGGEAELLRGEPRQFLELALELGLAREAAPEGDFLDGVVRVAHEQLLGQLDAEFVDVGGESAVPDVVDGLGDLLLAGLEGFGDVADLQIRVQVQPFLNHQLVDPIEELRVVFLFKGMEFLGKTGLAGSQGLLV